MSVISCFHISYITYRIQRTKEHGLFFHAMEALDMNWGGPIGFMALKNRCYFSIPTPDAGLPVIKLHHCILMFQLLGILTTIATVILLAELFLLKMAALSKRFYALCCAKVKLGSVKVKPGGVEEPENDTSVNLFYRRKPLPGSSSDEQRIKPITHDKEANQAASSTTKKPTITRPKIAP